MTSQVSASGNFFSLVERVRAAKLPPIEERRAIRKSAGISVEDIAVELGVRAITVWRWERGEAEPRTKHAIAYRQLLDALRAESG